MSKTIELDLKGKKCPLPIVEISQMGIQGKIEPGDIVIAQADCPNFKDEIKLWAGRVSKDILYLRDLGNGVAEVQLKW
jgi:TusA-related sulfurtransferase